MNQSSPALVKSEDRRSTVEFTCLEWSFLLCYNNQLSPYLYPWNTQKRAGTGVFGFLPFSIINYVPYFRVSTAGQGKSGLGLCAQREIVHRFLKTGDQLLDEFVEVESGKRADRPQLTAAIALAMSKRVPACSSPSSIGSAAMSPLSSRCAMPKLTS